MGPRLQWPFIFSNLKILVYWVTPVLIDLHRFILSLLGTHRFYILNQRPIAPNPFAVALEAPGDGDFNNTRSIAWCCHWCIYYDIDYMADNSILSHAQYPHNVPTALLTIQYAYARLLSSCCMVTPRVCGYGSRVATHDDFFLSMRLVWLYCIVSFKFSIQIEPHVILLWCAAGPSSIAFLSFHKPNTSFDSGQQIYISRCAPHAYLLLEGLWFQNNNCESFSFFFFLATLSRIARGT